MDMHVYLWISILGLINGVVKTFERKFEIRNDLIYECEIGIFDAEENKLKVFPALKENHMISID